MSILKIKTNLSEAFGKTGYSKSKPFESINPPKMGEFPQLLPEEVKETFSNSPKSSPTLSIDRNQTKFKISDFSVGDIIHTQPYISQEVRREVRFPATQINDHILRIGKFLDSPEGSLFIANQSMLHTFNVMPESFAGLTAANGVYKVYKSDNNIFSPIGIRASLVPGFHIERHKIFRNNTEEAFGRFSVDKTGNRSSFITEQFPGLIPTSTKINIKPEGGQPAWIGVLENFGQAFARRIQPGFENQLSSIVEQAFISPTNFSIKNVGQEFKSIAATALGGSIGELLGAGAKSLTERGTQGISDFFGGFNSNISFGTSTGSKLLSAAVNTGANIIVDTISTVAQRTFAEQVSIQANKAGVYVGKHLGIDPKFVTNSIQAAFAKDAIVLSQVSPSVNLNRFNIMAPYYEVSRHLDDKDPTNIFVKYPKDLTAPHGTAVTTRAGFARDGAFGAGSFGTSAFTHISRLADSFGIEHVPTTKDPFKNLDIGIGGENHRQIGWKAIPYKELISDADGIGSFHPDKIAQKINPKLYGDTKYTHKEKSNTMGKYSIGRGQDGYRGKQRVDDHLGLMRPSERSDKVTINRPGQKLQPDFIPFAFEDVHNKRKIQFRAILGAVTDTIRPEYEPIRYLGRADQVYIYKGAVRNVNFTFKVAAFTKQELVIGWEKLNYLVGLCYPAGYEQGRMVAPLTKLTIGKMFKDAPGLVNNVSLTIPDQSTWDINPNLELPKYVEASVDYQYIGEYKLKSIGKHYGLQYMEDEGDKLAKELNTTLTDVGKASWGANGGRSMPPVWERHFNTLPAIDEKIDSVTNNEFV